MKLLNIGYVSNETDVCIYSNRDLDTLLYKVKVITLENTLVFIHMQQ